MEKKIEQVSEVEKQFEGLVASYQKIYSELTAGKLAVRYLLKKDADGFLRNAKFCLNCVYSRADKEADDPFLSDRTCSLGLKADRRRKDTCGRHTRIPTEDLDELHDRVVEIQRLSWTVRHRDHADLYS